MQPYLLSRLSRVLWLVVVGILIIINPGCGGSPDQMGEGGINAANSQKIVDLQGEIDSLTAENRRLKGEVSMAKALLAEATDGQKEALRLALSPRDGRLWKCESTNGTVLTGRWASEAMVETQGQTLVIGLTKEGQNRNVLFCPAIGPLSGWKPGSSFGCPLLGSDPFTCSLAP